MAGNRQTFQAGLAADFGADLEQIWEQTRGAAAAALFRPTLVGVITLQTDTSPRMKQNSIVMVPIRMHLS